MNQEVRQRRKRNKAQQWNERQRYMQQRIRDADCKQLTNDGNPSKL